MSVTPLIIPHDLQMFDLKPGENDLFYTNPIYFSLCFLPSIYDFMLNNLFMVSDISKYAS